MRKLPQHSSFHHSPLSAMAINSHLGFIFSVWVLCTSLLHCYYGAHPGEVSAATTVTHPHEVIALKIIKEKMRNKKWDFSEDPCSGKGSWDVNHDYETQNNLVCTAEGTPFFHVTRIYLKSQNLTGVVPAELANLTYLEEIDFSCNHLNGAIPPELGSLSNLKNLSLGMNNLSGCIPKELGNLTNLLKIDLFSNELYGRLPRSFANLDHLEMLSIQSNRLHGKIPKIYGHLHQLKYFVASSNNFSGKIPDFIGNWKNLKILRLEATSLEGPIPSTISNLIQLEDLRISYLTGDGSNLSFIQNLTKLRTIVLKNALLYGQIPKYIGDSIKPKILDLSFNNLIGLIPRALENIPMEQRQIEYLYLGNNNLTGKLQEWLSTISYVDLSYNYFSGNLDAPWITNRRQINLIQNSFDSNVSNGSVQAYLQRRFSCRDPQYTSLDINCGGDQWSTYEGDVSPLGPSKYFLSSDGKWAVSNTGVFMDAEDHKFTVEADKSLFAKGIDTELYGTARCSSSSLRYYALCLQNGQYTVQLHFAEMVITNGMIFPSLGRRVFDVYIQGSRRLKDFNIKDAAGGSSYKVVIRNFTVNVTENYLEIHFFWAGKGTYDIPERGTYGPLVSAIKISPNFKINSNARNKSNKSTVIGIVFGAVIALGFMVCLSFIIIRKRKRTKSRSLKAADDTELINVDTISNTFSLAIIKNATSDFNPENKIGEGGFGAVFKGILPDGKWVAVKQMFHNSRQGIREFLNELGTISAMQHPNLVKLYGCCIEGKQLFLIYEYMENNSLARGLFGPEEFRLKLDWPRRYNICLGVAHGLAYLHEGSRLKIIHRDIKTTNILLDQHSNPKISDFGLAKLFDQDKTHVNTRVAGTIGYMAPEYALKGHLTEKADVYSFGVVVLEVVSGRTHTEKTMQADMVYLLEWTWHLYEKKRLLDLVDVNLKNSSYSEEEVLRVINVGLLCTNGTPMQRPSMSTVVEMLEGKIEAHVSHSRPSYLGNWQPNIFTEEKAPSHRENFSLGGPSNNSSSA